jgi:hypothetical protein
MGPVAKPEGHNPPRLIDEFVPSLAAIVDDIVIRFEDEVRQPVVPHELPDVFLWVELRGAGRRRQKGDGSRRRALAKVVFPDEVPPAIRMFERVATCERSASAMAGATAPLSTKSESEKGAAAGLRIAKQGAEATGGRIPSKRSPVPASSAEMTGWRRSQASAMLLATSRMIRSRAEAEIVSASTVIPCPTRSIQIEPSGFARISITSSASRAALASRAQHGEAALCRFCVAGGCGHRGRAPVCGDRQEFPMWRRFPIVRLLASARQIVQRAA